MSGNDAFFGTPFYLILAGPLEMLLQLKYVYCFNTSVLINLTLLEPNLKPLESPPSSTQKAEKFVYGLICKLSVSIEGHLLKQ